MSMSLRDQLLAAGFASKQQAKKAREQEQAEKHQQRHQQSRHKPAGPSLSAAAAMRAQAEKAERDLELNRKRQAKAEAKALRVQIRQWAAADMLPRIESEQTFNFVDGGKVRRVAVDADRRALILSGAVVIVRVDGNYLQLPAAAAARIIERDPAALVALDAGATPAESAVADDPYKDFVVPDDLVW
jgi:uncharacterized protein YaiL (DUF2058 family)